MMRIAAALMPLLAWCAAGVAQAAKPCVAPAELDAVIATILPAAVSGAARQCSVALPAGAYLARSGDALAARLRPAAIAAVPAARGALGRIAGLPLPGTLGAEAMLDLIDAGMGGQILAKLKPEDCGTIDRAVAQLDPLQPRALATLVASLAILGMDDDADFTLCRPGAQR